MTRSCSSTEIAFHVAEVVQVLLHDHVAAAGEVGILVADGRRLVGRRPGRILGAVDEAEQVALVEVLEAVGLVDDVGPAGQPVHQLRGQLEAQIHPSGPEVEQQVARRGDGGVPGADDLPERVQLGRPRAAEQPVPQSRTDPDDAAQLAVRDPEADRPPEPGHVGRADPVRRPRHRPARSRQERSPPR